jgi:hypothetical protein
MYGIPFNIKDQSLQNVKVNNGDKMTGNVAAEKQQCAIQKL